MPHGFSDESVYVPSGNERSRRELLADEGGEVVDLVTEAYWRGWLDARNAARAAVSGERPMPAAPDATRTYLAERSTRLHVSGAAYDIASERTIATSD